MDKKELKEREAKVIEFAVVFCNERLDEECATFYSTYTETWQETLQSFTVRKIWRYGQQIQFIQYVA